MNANARPYVLDAATWTMLLVLSALWGSSFLFFALLVTELPPLTVVLGRVGLAALMLNLLLAVRGMPMRATLPWRDFAVMGLLNNLLPFLLITLGVARIPSGLAAILNATTPIFTVLAAHWLTTDERLTPAKAAGVACGFAGVVLLIGPGLLGGMGQADTLGQLCCLGAAVSYAFAGLYGRRFRALAPLQVATGQVTASTVLLLPVALAVDRIWTLPMPSATAWAALVGIALLCTAAGYVLYFAVLARAGATNLVLVTFLLPVTALLLGALVLGEPVSARALAGMAVIGLGLAAIDGRLLRALSRR
jgi:drug/metabolite transporter (DMT)-like permease